MHAAGSQLHYSNAHCILARPETAVPSAVTSVDSQKNQEAARMPKPKVYSTHPLFEEARKILDANCDVQYWSEPERPPREEFLRRVKDREGRICLLTEKINDELLRAAPKLRIVANVAVGFDNIDVDACTKRGVVATNTPGVLDETTADFAWTLLLAVARRLSEGEALARSGNWKGWNLDQLCGADIWGKTLGIVGLAVLAGRWLAAPRVFR